MNRIEWEKTTVRHTVRCYDYLSDNLADDFVTFIGCNTLIDKNLRQMQVIRTPARLYVFS